jgi:hypothetical protein
MVLEILNPKLILMVLYKSLIDFIPLIINFASVAKPFTFAVARYIAAIKFAFVTIFHYSFLLMIA